MKGLTRRINVFMAALIPHRFDNRPRGEARRDGDFHEDYKRKAKFHNPPV
jgi:hypothetical protein